MPEQRSEPVPPDYASALIMIGELRQQLTVAEVDVKRYKYILGIRNRIEELEKMFPHWLVKPAVHREKWKIILKRRGHFRVDQLLGRLQSVNVDPDVCAELLTSFYRYASAAVHTVTSDELSDEDKESVFKLLGIIDRDTQQVLMVVTKGFDTASGLHMPSQLDEENIYVNIRMLTLRNVHYQATIDDIKKFFFNVEIESIQMRDVKRGIVQVTFKNINEAILAMKDNEKSLRRRDVQISLQEI